MKNTGFLFLVLFLIISCGKPIPLSGVIVNEIRTISADFNEVESTCAYNVEITDGVRDGKIKISGDSSIVDKIVIELKNNRLIISQKPGFYTSHGESVKVLLSANDLNGLFLTGSGSIITNSVQTSDSFRIVLDGSGNIDTKISSNSADIQLNGSGDININGNVKNLKAGISGSGDIHSFGLNASSVNAGLTGSGNLEVMATDHLIGGVTGSGKIIYKGKPATKEINVVGSGEVVNAN